ncbi:hypothetical protein HDU97_009133 [Phlyctochytrium planicorne]|nr:hypothetical protein HDU97_009133 [Phlyctochytrium planicorne]
MFINGLIKSITLISAFVASSAVADQCKAGKYFDKVVTIILENEDASAVFQDPYFGTTLAQKGYLLTNMNGVAHPSEPNYVAMIGGSTFNIADDGKYDLSNTNLVDLLEAKGVSWKSYQENYPGNCAKGTSYSNGLYRRKHNPFISFTNISGDSNRCAKIVEAGQFASDLASGNLPAYSFYTPNMDNDGHDTGLSFASDWLKGFLTGKLGSAGLKNTLVMVTFDESETSSPNKIYGVLIGAGAKGAGLTDGTRYDHYSWLATIEDNFSLGNLGRKDATANLIPLVAGGCTYSSTPSSTTVVVTSTSTVVATSTSVPPVVTTTTTSVPPVTSTTVVPTSTAVACAHDKCVSGTVLKSACDPCVAQIIAQDSYCGKTKWDSQCVSEDQCKVGKYFDRVITIVLENQDATSAYRDSYLGGALAQKGFLLTNMYGVTHPSQGNYIAMTGGSTFNVVDDSKYDISKTNIVDLLESKGLSWKSYQQNYPGDCFTKKKSDDGLYRRKHNPFISYTNVSGSSKRCAKIVDAGEFESDLAKGKLPNYSFYTPNMDNDGHDTSLGYASKWLKNFLDSKIGTAALKNTLIFVTFDESETDSPNKIYGALIGAGIKGTGLTDGTRYDHYSWLATIEDNFSLGNLGRNDASANRIPLVAGKC